MPRSGSGAHGASESRSASPTAGKGRSTNSLPAVGPIAAIAAAAANKRLWGQAWVQATSLQGSSDVDAAQFLVRKLLSTGTDGEGSPDEAEVCSGQASIETPRFGLRRSVASSGGAASSAPRSVDAPRFFSSNRHVHDASFSECRKNGVAVCRSAEHQADARKIVRLVQAPAQSAAAVARAPANAGTGCNFSSDPVASIARADASPSRCNPFSSKSLGQPPRRTRSCAPPVPFQRQLMAPDVSGHAGDGVGDRPARRQHCEENGNTEFRCSAHQATNRTVHTAQPCDKISACVASTMVRHARACCPEELGTWGPDTCEKACQPRGDETMPIVEMGRMTGMASHIEKHVLCQERTRLDACSLQASTLSTSVREDTPVRNAIGLVPQDILRNASGTASSPSQASIAGDLDVCSGCGAGIMRSGHGGCALSSTAASSACLSVAIWSDTEDAPLGMAGPVAPPRLRTTSGCFGRAEVSGASLRQGSWSASTDSVASFGPRDSPRRMRVGIDVAKHGSINSESIVDGVRCIGINLVGTATDGDGGNAKADLPGVGEEVALCTQSPPSLQNQQSLQDGRCSWYSTPSATSVRDAMRAGVIAPNESRTGLLCDDDDLPSAAAQGGSGGKIACTGASMGDCANLTGHPEGGATGGTGEGGSQTQSLSGFTIVGACAGAAAGASVVDAGAAAGAALRHNSPGQGTRSGANEGTTLTDTRTPLASDNNFPSQLLPSVCAENLTAPASVPAASPVAEALTSTQIWLAARDTIGSFARAPGRCPEHTVFEGGNVGERCLAGASSLAVQSLEAVGVDERDVRAPHDLEGGGDPLMGFFDAANPTEPGAGDSSWPRRVLVRRKSWPLIESVKMLDVAVCRRGDTRDEHLFSAAVSMPLSARSRGDDSAPGPFCARSFEEVPAPTARLPTECEVQLALAAASLIKRNGKEKETMGQQRNTRYAMQLRQHTSSSGVATRSTFGSSTVRPGWGRPRPKSTYQQRAEALQGMVPQPHQGLFSGLRREAMVKEALAHEMMISKSSTGASACTSSYTVKRAIDRGYMTDAKRKDFAKTLVEAQKTLEKHEEKRHEEERQRQEEEKQREEERQAEEQKKAEQKRAEDAKEAQQEKDGKDAKQEISKGKGKGKGKGAPPALPTAKAKAKPEPRKPEVKPTVPMKKLFWDSFRLLDKEKETIWWDIDKAYPSIDTTKLEELFPDAQAAVRIRNNSDDCGSVKKIKVLPDTRRQQICVMMKRLQDQSDTCDAIQCMDTYRLSADHVELLMTILPLPDEIDMLRRAEAEHTIDEHNVWDTAERFMFMLLEIPHFKLRLQVLNFEASFPDTLSNLRASLFDIEAGCACLLNSPRISHLLGIVLSVGNYLNGGTMRGRADGFGMGALGQLKTVKAKEARKGTLVDYVVEQMDATYLFELNEMFAPGGDVERLQRASRIKVEDVTIDLSSLCSTAGEILRGVKARRDAEGETFGRHCEIMAMCAAELEDLVTRHRRLESKCSEVCGWFRLLEGNTRAACDELFGTVAKFISDLRAVRNKVTPKARKPLRKKAKRTSVIVRKSPKTAAKSPKITPKASTRSAVHTPPQSPRTTPRVTPRTSMKRFTPPRLAPQRSTESPRESKLTVRTTGSMPHSPPSTPRRTSASEDPHSSPTFGRLAEMAQTHSAYSASTDGSAAELELLELSMECMASRGNKCIPAKPQKSVFSIASRTSGSGDVSPAVRSDDVSIDATPSLSAALAAKLAQQATGSAATAGAAGVMTRGPSSTKDGFSSRRTSLGTVSNGSSRGSRQGGGAGASGATARSSGVATGSRGNLRCRFQAASVARVENKEVTTVAAESSSSEETSAGATAVPKGRAFANSTQMGRAEQRRPPKSKKSVSTKSSIRRPVSFLANQVAQAAAASNAAAKASTTLEDVTRAASARVAPTVGKHRVQDCQTQVAD